MPINREDILAANAIKEIIADFELWEQKLNQVKTTLTSLGEGLKSDVSKNAQKNAEDVKKMVADLNQLDQVNKGLNQTKQQQNTIEKQKAKLNQQLNQLQTDEGKNIERLKLEISEKRKQIREEIKETNQQIGTIQKLENENKKLSKERKNLNLQTEAGRKRLRELNKTIDRNNKFIKQNVDQLAKQRMNVGNYTQSILKAVDSSGVFSGAMKKMKAISVALKGGFGGLSLGAKGLGKALIAIPIFAVITAIMGLVSWFSRTQAGADLLERALGAVSTVLDVIFDRLSNIGGIIIDFISGNKSLAETLGDVKEQFKGVNDEIREEIALKDELIQAQHRLRDTQTALIVTYADLKTRIARARRDANDETLSLQEQAAAIEETIRLTRLMNDIKIKQAKEAERIAVENAKLAINDDEANRVMQKAIAATMKLRAQADDQERSLLRRRNTLQNNINAERMKERTTVEAMDAAAIKLTESTKEQTLAIGNNVEALEKQQQEFNNNLKRQQEFNELVAKSYQVTSDAIVAGFDNRAKAYQRTLQREQALNQQNIAIQTRLAEAGLENQLEIEQKRAAELALKKEREAEAQVRREKVKAYYAAFTQELQNGEGAQAATKALAQLAIADGISRLITGSFYEGTEDTGRANNSIDSKGGRLAILHDNERILTKKQNEAIKSAYGHISNDALVQLITSQGTQRVMQQQPIVNVNQEVQRIEWDSFENRIESKINKAQKKTIVYVKSNRPKLW